MEPASATRSEVYRHDRADEGEHAGDGEDAEMSVFVDNARNSYGRMKMCHMIAHTTAELLAMARAIGVQEKWIQKAGTPREHFDICASKRTLAIEHGAIPIGNREFVALLNEKRAMA